MCAVSMSHSCDHYRYELPFPHIAAGDNLNLPVLGSFFRHRQAALAARRLIAGIHIHPFMAAAVVFL